MGLSQSGVLFLSDFLTSYNCSIIRIVHNIWFHFLFEIAHETSRTLMIEVWLKKEADGDLTFVRHQIFFFKLDINCAVDKFSRAERVRRQELLFTNIY